MISVTRNFGGWELKLSQQQAMATAVGQWITGVHGLRNSP